MRKEISLILAIILILSTVSAFDFGMNSGKAAVIELDGAITPTSSPGAFSSGSSLTPSNVRELNSKAMERNPDAIIYEWNSPGGAVVASKEIKREIESVDTPTVCRFRDLAASGAYLASLGCDRIVADSASMTGSIGVKSSYLEFSDLMEKYGVEYVNVSSGEYKSIASPYEDASEKDIEFLKNKTDRIHRQFTSMVEEERNLTAREVEKIGNGKVFLGSKAEELGLVDTLGGRETALESAENITGKDLEIREVETAPSFGLLSLLSASSPLENLGLDRTPIMKAVWR